MYVKILRVLAVPLVGFFSSNGDDDNNNNDLFCANILVDQAQWRDKTKGLSKLVIVKQCVSHQWMDEEAQRLRMIGSIKKRLSHLMSECLMSLCSHKVRLLATKSVQSVHTTRLTCNIRRY